MERVRRLCFWRVGGYLGDGRWKMSVYVSRKEGLPKIPKHLSMEPRLAIISDNQRVDPYAVYYLYLLDNPTKDCHRICHHP